jgi:hypothetical protein
VSSLIVALSAQPFPREIQVWTEGMAGWQPAGSVPELSHRLPPPPRVPPPTLPGAAPNLGMHRREVPFDEAVAIARLYRRLVLLIGLQILLGLGRIPLFLAIQGADSALPSIVLGLVFTASLLVIGILTVVTTYKLAGHIASTPLAWALAMFLPCINILFLLILSSKAQDWCRQYGIRVGILGPSLESIEELRRSASTSAFD